MTRFSFPICCVIASGCIMGCSDNQRNSAAQQPDPAVVLAAADRVLSGERTLDELIIQQVLSVETDNPDLLLWLAGTAHGLGRQMYHDGQTKVSIPLFLKAGDAMQQAERSGQTLLRNQRAMRGSIYYDEACARSLNGEPEEALAPLRRAVEGGYGDIGMFAADSDLDGVRKLPQYSAFYAEMLKQTRAKILQEMREFESYPLTFDLPDLAGNSINLADMKGTVVVLDLWATWCRPCLMTMPHLEEIYQANHSEGLEIIGLAYERANNDEYIAKVKSVCNELKITYPIAMGDKATSGQIPDLRSIPTMVFLDRTGRVRFHVSGAHSRDYLLAILEPLLEEKPGEPSQRTDSSEAALN